MIKGTVRIVKQLRILTKVYGAIIDNTCILWQSECGETTNCIVYSTVALRQVISHS